MNRCSGHCCEAIRIPASPSELEAGAYPNGAEITGARVLHELLEPTGEVTSWGDHVYRCKAYVGGECSIYHQRPTMCLDFPYGRPCPYPDCTWDAARAGEVRNPVHLPMWQPEQNPDEHVPWHVRRLAGRAEVEAILAVQRELAEAE